jgi:hypothetical protein
MGTLATLYVTAFRQKWLGTAAALVDPQALLGSGDIQSLADLANSVNVVRDARLMPFSRKCVVRLAIMLAIPILPLMLTMIPIDQIVNRALKLVL